MYETRQFRKGLKIELEGVPYQIVDFQHVSPGKGSAFTRTKLQNMLNQNVTERTFRSGDKVDQANTQQKAMQYLYKDSDSFYFMDTESYEQLVLNAKILGESVGYLQENLTIQVMFFNDLPIGIELPTFVELKVVTTDPAFRGDTVTGGGKPAKLETGTTVTVPFHIKEGDILKIDTRDGSYVEKVNR